MEQIKYKVIKSKQQYYLYCKEIEKLTSKSPQTKLIKDEIELLTLLIETWDVHNNTFKESDPVVLLKSLMNENNLRPKDLVDILGLSKGYISDILNYKKGFSKDIIRNLSTHFKVSQEAFNRPYKRKKTSKEIVYASIR